MPYSRPTFAWLFLSAYALLWIPMSSANHVRSEPSSSSQKQIIAIFEKAYAGDTHAQMDIAHHYLDGTHVEQSEKKAAQWFKTAATAGNPEAQTQLGLMYFSGSGVQVDQSQAVIWLGKAAEQNYDPALDLLHWMSQAAH
ncbi:tetratricopeptide repeat protein [Vibrio alginolyticus]